MRKLIATLALIVALPTVALALGDSTRDNTHGVNGPVRAVLHAGGNVWVGGKFTQVVRNAGNANIDAETNLAAFSPSGQWLNIGPELGGTNAIVYDLALGPNNTVYAAGLFTASGATNLIAFNATTGQVTNTYSTPALFSVHHDGAQLWAGSKTALLKVTSATSETTVVTIATGGTATATRSAQMSDITDAPQGGLFIACKCDLINDGSRLKDAKAFAHITAAGDYDEAWRPSAGENAVGWEIAVSGGVAYLAAGGSDFVEAVNASNANLLWKTDLNGQAQTVAVQGSRLLVGGHWRMVESYCQPRLAALNISDGRIDTSWHPAPNPKYPGVWSVIDVNGSVWAGGEFTKMATNWQRSFTLCTGTDTMPTTSGTNLPTRNIARFAP